MTSRTVAAQAIPVLLAIAGFPATAASFVEVQLAMEVGGESLRPVVIAELGKTTELRYTFNESGNNRANDRFAPASTDSADNVVSSSAEVGPAPTNFASSGNEHRILLTVNTYRDMGYRVNVEYMTRPQDKWVTQWMPSMLVKAGVQASMQAASPSGELSKLTIQLEPRHDVASYGDLRHAFLTPQERHATAASRPLRTSPPARPARSWPTD